MNVERMHNQINKNHKTSVKTDARVIAMKNEDSVELLFDELRHRFAKSFLDLLILQLVETKPTWGYDIIKKTDTKYKFKLRHGALYPMLSKLETNGLVKCTRELKKGRVRKIYEITNDGKVLLHAYYRFLTEQLPKKTNYESEETRNEREK